MPLAIVLPTRRRWRPWLLHQLDLLAPQLAPDDALVLVVDCDTMPEDVFEQAREQFGPRLTIVQLSYARADVPDLCINRARNAGAAMAPAGYDLVEVDDHDFLKPDALARIRAAFECAADYVFAGFSQQAVIEFPNRQIGTEVWPDVRRTYTRWAFERREVEALGGVRGIRRSLWKRLGGWSETVWPCADMEFARRAEAAGAKIVCLERALCTVTIDGDSLMGVYRGARPAAAEAI